MIIPKITVNFAKNDQILEPSYLSAALHIANITGSK